MIGVKKKEDEFFQLLIELRKKSSELEKHL